VKRTVSVERELGRVDPTWLTGDPLRWLPQPVRRSGPDRWTFHVHGGPATAAVRCQVGDVWRRGGWASRRLAWQPVHEGEDRVLPSLQGQLAWAVHEDGVTLRFLAAYEPPGWLLGAALDRLALHRLAEGTLERFVDDVVAAWPVPASS
jgi:hypothetical protein